MKVLIIGAGLGGLTAALCFAKHGHDVYILERRERLTPQGGGIVIRPSACSILHSLGLEAGLEGISDRTSTTLVRSIETGEISKGTYPIRSLETPEWGTTRKDVMDLLYKEVSKAGVTIRFGIFVENIHDEPGKGRPYITFEDGKHIHGDIILVADGIKSQLRAKVLSDLGSAPEPLISTTTFYGLTVQVSELKKHPGTMRLINQTEVNVWFGKGSFVVTRHNSKTKQVSCLFAIQSETDQKDLWDESGDIDYVRRFFAASCSELTVALHIVEGCDRWKLAEMPQLPRWTSRAGRVVLLGDSAHAMLPNAAQGYSQIVEDIGVLSFLINDGMRSQKLVEVTKTWQDIRMPRVERIRQFSEWNTRQYLGKDTTPTEMGSWDEDNRRWKNMSDMNAGFQTSAFLKWVTDFDAVEEAKRYLSHRTAKSPLASSCI